MKNIILLSCLLIISCKATKKVTSVSCCKDKIEANQPLLIFPAAYSPNCESIICYDLEPNVYVDCFNYKLFSRFGNEIFEFSVNEAYTNELERPLIQKFEELEHDGTYYFVATYSTKDSCYNVKGYLQNHK